MELFSIRLDHAKGCLHLLLFGCSEVAAASCHQASRDIIGCEVAGAQSVSTNYSIHWVWQQEWNCLGAVV